MAPKPLVRFLLMIGAAVALSAAMCQPNPPDDGKKKAKNDTATSKNDAEDIFVPQKVLTEYQAIELSDAIQLPDPDVTRQFGSTLLGSIWVQRTKNGKTGVFRAARIVAEEKDVEIPKLDVEIKDEFIAQKGFKTDASVLSVLTANLAADEKLQVTHEIMLKGILHNWDLATLQRWICGSTAPNGEEYYYLTGILVSRFGYKKFQKLQAGAKITGVAFGVGTDVYTSDERTKSAYEVDAQVLPLKALYPTCKDGLATATAKPPVDFTEAVKSFQSKLRKDNSLLKDYQTKFSVIER